MIEAVTSVAGAALTLMWPFYWPLLVVLELRVLYEVFVRGVVPPGRATQRTLLLSGAVGLLGGTAIVCAIVPGVIAHALTRYFYLGSPSSNLVMELLDRQGLARVALFVLFTELALLLFGAGVGALLWMWFGKGAPHMTLRQWVRQNTVLWSRGFVASLLAALVIAAVIRGVQPAFVLGLGGLVTALAATTWVLNVAKDFDPEPEAAKEQASIAVRVPPSLP
jgi:hypothetical protein